MVKRLGDYMILAQIFVKCCIFTQVEVSLWVESSLDEGFYEFSGDFFRCFFVLIFESLFLSLICFNFVRDGIFLARCDAADCETSSCSYLGVITFRRLKIVSLRGALIRNIVRACCFKFCEE